MGNCFKLGYSADEEQTSPINSEFKENCNCKYCYKYKIKTLIFYENFI